MSKFSAKSLIQTLSPAEHLDHNKGAAGFTIWITLMVNVLIAAGTTGAEFTTGISQAPVAPTLYDLRPFITTPRLKPQPSTKNPTTNPHRTRSTTPHPRHTPGATPDTADDAAPATKPATSTRAPKYLYEREPDDPNELSSAGTLAYQAATDKYDARKEKYDEESRFTFTLILSQLLQSTQTALQNDPTYPAVRATCDCAGLHHVLTSLFKNPTIRLSQAAFTGITNLTQGSGSVTEFANTCRLNISSFTASYECPTNKGFVSIETLHNTIFLTGLTKASDPIMDKILLSKLTIHDLKIAELQADALQYEANTKHHTRPNNPNNNRDTDKTKGKPKVATEQYVQALMTNLTLNTKTPPNANPNPNTNTNTKTRTSSLPPNDPTLWTPTHPHCRPRGPGTGPGTTDGGPGSYCAHCAKNGYIITNPLHLQDCKDAIRAAALTQPQGLFNGIDLSTLGAVATALGVPEENN
jgi:hypothetical protein